LRLAGVRRLALKATGASATCRVRKAMIPQSVFAEVPAAACG